MRRKRNAEYVFAWDLHNRVMHEPKGGHIPFVKGCQAFADPHHMVKYLGFVNGEPRWQCLAHVTGSSKEGIVSVVYTLRYYGRTQAIWIISPRIANRSERKRYYAQNKD